MSDKTRVISVHKAVMFSMAKSARCAEVEIHAEGRRMLQIEQEVRTTPQAALCAVVRCSRLPRRGQTKQMYYYYCRRFKDVTGE
jgi:hypothetical protein